MNVELNITLRCNQRCANCNRLCHLFPERTEDMTVDQIDRFLDLLRAKPGRVGRVKVVGGEPLLHPQFDAIYQHLRSALGAGLFRGLAISTNRTVRHTYSGHPKGRWIGQKPKRKCHLPVLWSPQDMGVAIKGPCGMPRRCGVSLDHWGFLPCSGAMMLVRVLGAAHLYRRELPDGPWGLDGLCEHCVFAMPRAWQSDHCRRLSEILPEEKTPTRTWARAMMACSRVPPLSAW